jgi:hypothetical protein
MGTSRPRDRGATSWKSFFGSLRNAGTWEYISRLYMTNRHEGSDAFSEKHELLETVLSTPCGSTSASLNDCVQHVHYICFGFMAPSREPDEISLSASRGISSHSCLVTVQDAAHCRVSFQEATGEPQDECRMVDNNNNNINNNHALLLRLALQITTLTAQQSMTSRSSPGRSIVALPLILDRSSRFADRSSSIFEMKEKESSEKRA